ncbi:MAG: hypothetical protein D3923_09965, partial [Candidatus Electrothrix sp. AR3]|nr:hypothetical protein [Candidatus Electrothrix sp. AR3]
MVLNALRNCCLNAPILQNEFTRHAENLKGTLRITPDALSEERRKEREEALQVINDLSNDVLEINFSALALGQQPPAYKAVCPFPGLNAFQTKNQNFFSGREDKIEKLTNRLQNERFLALLGPSGCGKSSLVLAGMFPALKKQGEVLLTQTMTPSTDNDPISALTQRLETPLAPGQSLLLVIDQLEELFILVNEPETQEQFLSLLLDAWKSRTDLYLILTLREFFQDDFSLYPEFEKLIQQHQEFIKALTDDELRNVVKHHTDQARLRFEDAYFMDEILEDFTGEPGAMPLLQLLLRELWDRRHGRWLRKTEFREMNGIERAILDITSTADDLYNDLQEDREGQGLLRNLFVRLIWPNDTPNSEGLYFDSCQRVSLDDLIPISIDTAQVRRLLQRLINARLLVTSVDIRTGEYFVEISHEALTYHWAHLRTWLNEDREILVLLASVRWQAKEWRDNGEPEDDLPGWGPRLQQAEAWFTLKRFAPNTLEDRFVQAVKSLDKKRKKEKKEALKRIEEALAEATHNIGLALNEKAKRAERKADNLFSHLYSLHALEKLSQKKGPEAFLEAVFRAQANPVQLPALTIQHTKAVFRVAFSPDGRMLASTSSNIVQLWDASTGALLKTLEGHTDTTHGIAFSPDGKII